MKKMLCFGAVLLLLVGMVGAYNTIVTIKVNSITCDSCAFGELTGITGTAGKACVATSSFCDCTTLGAENTAIGGTIKEGGQYTTLNANLVQGTAYYACLKLTESAAGATAGALNGCGSAQANSRYFGLVGATCNGWNRGYISSYYSAQQIIFGFLFIA